MALDRVCGALIRGEKILMVRHQTPGTRAFWTLPGGGVEDGETPEAAVIREVREETGLHVSVAKLLWENPWGDGAGLERGYLVETLDPGAEPEPGFDPEESHLDPLLRTLQEAKWINLAAMRDDVQVRRVLAALGRPA